MSTTLIWLILAPVCLAIFALIWWDLATTTARPALRIDPNCPHHNTEEPTCQ